MLASRAIRFGASSQRVEVLGSKPLRLGTPLLVGGADDLSNVEVLSHLPGGEASTVS